MKLDNDDDISLQFQQVTVNESSPGVTEMNVGKVNTQKDIGSNEHDFREEEDKEQDEERDEEEEAVAKIFGQRQKLSEINSIAQEMHQTGMVSKAHRVALESYDEDDVLPNSNSYTAAPSHINYEETVAFVNEARYKVAGNTYKTMCTNMADNIHAVASTISELPTYADMKQLLQDHQESVRAISNLKLPDEYPGNILDNSVLDEGLRAYTRDAHPDDDGEELLECKSAFHEPMIVMGNSIRLQRFIQQAHSIRMSELTTSAAGKFNDDYDEQQTVMLELLARAHELAEYDVRDAPNQTPLTITAMKRGAIQPPDVPYTSAEINNWIICDTTIYLLYNPNNDSGECGLPFDIKTVLDKFVASMTAAPEYPDNPHQLVAKTEALRESVHALNEALDVYTYLIEKFVKLMKRSTHFYNEMYKILDAAIQAAVPAPTVKVNVE